MLKAFFLRTPSHLAFLVLEQLFTLFGRGEVGTAGAVIFKGKAAGGAVHTAFCQGHGFWFHYFLMTKKYRSKITMVGMEESPLLSLRFISGKFFFSKLSTAIDAATAKMNAIHSPAV